MAKESMPIYGIIGIFKDVLDHSSAKYQYFSMRPSLFVVYYLTIYSLLVEGQFIFKCRFYDKKFKNCTKSAMSQFAIFNQFQSRPTFFNIST